MNRGSNPRHSGASFAKTEDKIVFASNGFKRVEQLPNGLYSQLVDIHLEYNVKVHYLNVFLEDAPKQINIIDGLTVCHAIESCEFGILLKVNLARSEYTVWLPVAPKVLLFDKHQRIVHSSKPRLFYKWDIYPHLKLDLLQSGRIGEMVVVPYMIQEDPNGQFYDEIKSLTNVEQRCYRKSDWFFAKAPSDIWNYLINGSLYDPRFHKGIEKQYKCQQCAYSWWNYFGFLFKETEKKVYDILQNEVAFSILLDMSENGEWGHGYHSDELETHSRFHLDGIHLLISQYEKTGDGLWLDAAELGMGFIFSHLVDQLDDGSKWFLHDTIEYSRKHNVKSTLFGKNPGNSLCINTHVQALTVLFRLRHLIPDKKIYSEMFENGARALHRVLDYQPMEPIYRLLMFMLIKYKTTRSSKFIIGKLGNVLMGLVIPRVYWSVRRKFPRIVYPGGFIERDISRVFFSDRYHITNIKDLLTLYQQEQLPWLRPYIEDGVAFVRKFLDKSDLITALTLSPFYIELIDILYIYDALIEHVTPEEMDSVKEAIYQQSGGYSIDYYASGLVRGK